MFNFFQKENRINKARPQTNNLLKRGLVFGFVFLLVLTTALGTLPIETHAMTVNDDPGAGQRGTPPTSEGPGLISRLTALPFNTALEALATVLLGITSLILWIAAETFEYIIRLSIINLHEYIGSGGIEAAWETFRDVANMFFIFILLYIAIGTILGLSNVNLKKMLARVIIVALLINFSFFFTKVVVDASNIIAVSFYNQIVKAECGTGTAGAASNIGTAFMCKLGLANLWDPSTLSGIGETTGGGWGQTGKIITFGVVGSIFLLITAFVFMAAAIMFIVRFVALIFLFIFSPLAFAAMALPNDKYSEKWVKPLISNCILAPAYMAATWAVLKIIGGITKDSGLLSEAILGSRAGQPIADAGQTFVNFIIIIALIITTLIVAKLFGGYGSEGALKMLGNGRKWAQGKLGRGMVRASGIHTLDERIKGSEWGNTRTGRAFRSITTGAITEQKFGSKSSTSDIDKKLEKGDEKQADLIAENYEKKIKAEAEAKADKEVNDVNAYETKFADLNSQIATKKIELKRYEDLATTPGVSPDDTKKHAADVGRVQIEIDKLTREKSQNEKKLERARRGGGATKEEKQEAVLNAKKEYADRIEKKGQMSNLRTRISAGGGSVAGAVSGAMVGATAGPIGAVVGGTIGAFWGGWAGSRRIGGSASNRKAIVTALRGKKKKSGGDGNKNVDVEDFMDDPNNEDIVKAIKKKAADESKNKTE